MNSSQRITLKAFLITLAQQKSSLPADMQTQLKEISQDISSNLGKLYNLGETYLGQLYLDNDDLLHQPAAQRNKGLPADIDEEAQRRNTETHNMVEVIDAMDDDTLKKTAKGVFSNAASGEEIRQAIYQVVNVSY